MEHEHEHGHNHEHNHDEDGHEKSSIVARLIASGLLFLITLLLPDALKPGGFIIAYIIISYDILRRAVMGIYHGEVFDEAFLMSIATLGAIAIQEFPEAVMVMFLYQLGEFFQDMAVGKARKSVRALTESLPDTVNVYRDGKLVTVKPSEVAVGEIITAKPGEKIALDGVLISDGIAAFDTAGLTGESVPRELKKGDPVLSGYINLNSTVSVTVSKPESESAAAVIARLTEESADKKAKSELFITKFSKVYTPTVVILAVLLAIIPCFVTMSIEEEYIKRALSFLVVSCPCALVISVPLAYFSGIGTASKRGVLVKGGTVIDTLANVSDAVFDKTGTLTTGEFSISKISPLSDFSSEQILKLAAVVESGSNHPIAKAIVRAYIEKQGSELPEKVEIHEIAGIGVSADLPEGEVSVRKSSEGVDVVLNGAVIGNICISDTVKLHSAYTIKKLSEIGVTSHMLSGDRAENAKKTADVLKISDVHADLLPTGKVTAFESIKKSAHGAAVFVGDGINDAPVLALADCGFAMGGLGQAAAVEAADAVIADDDPAKVITAIKISKKTRSIAIQNIIFSLVVKFAVLVLSALGVTGIELAVFADVGVSIIAVANSLRAQSLRKERV
ncbi:MAG: cadmium-translocating P-type ATPase [Ruminococcus sp.]|jgi:Cd2+/Zn2+-exporting ATPase|nr:cadmium-translocating P-type ATPase [Ruminococcus sp.]